MKRTLRREGLALVALLAACCAIRAADTDDAFRRLEKAARAETGLGLDAIGALLNADGDRALLVSELSAERRAAFDLLTAKGLIVAEEIGREEGRLIFFRRTARGEAIVEAIRDAGAGSRETE